MVYRLLQILRQPTVFFESIKRKTFKLFTDQPSSLRELHTTLSITELLSQPKGRRGFRPSKVLGFAKVLFSLLITYNSW